MHTSKICMYFLVLCIVERKIFVMNDLCENCLKFQAKKYQVLKECESVFDAASIMHNFVDTCKQYGCINQDIETANEDIEIARTYTIDEVAQILYDIFNDSCACNYNRNDEWLPDVCDNRDDCMFSEKCTKDNLYCWKQFLKHYDERNQNDK